MTIKEAKNQTSTWKWEKYSVKIDGATYTDYTFKDWEIKIYLKRKYQKATRSYQNYREIFIIHGDKKIDIRKKWGNVFTNISQVKKYVEFVLSPKKEI